MVLPWNDFFQLLLEFQLRVTGREGRSRTRPGLDRGSSGQRWRVQNSKDTTTTTTGILIGGIGSRVAVSVARLLRMLYILLVSVLGPCDAIPLVCRWLPSSSFLGAYSLVRERRAVAD